MLDPPGSRERLNPAMTLKHLAAILFSATSLSAQPATFDPQKIGPQVGERIPDFSAPDQNGDTRTLQSILGPKGAILLFNRSADW